MSAELLRRAASLMRERAEGATPGPWEVYSGPRKMYVESVAAEDASGNPVPIMQSIDRGAFADVGHIASWHPVVALAVADWLDDALEAHLHVRVGNYRSYLKAVEVARAYLGDDA